MPVLRPSVLRYAAVKPTSATRQAARDALKARSSSTTIPALPTCPSPTCACADMPPDLDIDQTTDLNSTMAPYSEHLLISSGQADWKSKIENEKGTAPWGDLVANVKSALGLKGQFHNPYHNVVVSTSSFSTPSEALQTSNTQALLFPSFRMVNQIKVSEREVPDFIRRFLLPEALHPAYDQHTEEEKAGKVRDTTDLSTSSWATKVHPITSPTILICSHNSRDSRCGVLGPLLHAEFSHYINKRHTLRNLPVDELQDDAATDKTVFSHPDFNPDLIDEKSNSQPINVGMISHIGGHKFAGNVIIYIPPDYQCRPLERVSRGAKPRDNEDLEQSSSSLPPEDDSLDSIPTPISPLAGKGVWYGRVEPKHVEGIVEQTIGHGRIIKDLFRGGINQDGSLIRLPLY